MPQSTERNLFDQYQQCFGEPDAPLLTTPEGARYSYADADAQSARLANQLVQMGLSKGDRVSVQIEKSVEGLCLFLAVIRAGMVFHPLNTAYTDDELRYFLEDAGTSLFVCDPSREQALQILCDSLGVAHLRTLDANGYGSLVQGAQEYTSSFTTVKTLGSDLAALCYSSGTTGKPKGIMLTHTNLFVNAKVLVTAWGI